MESRKFSYRTMIRKEFVHALRKLFPNNIGYEEYTLDKINFSISYTNELEKFPHVTVSYSESSLSPVGISDSAQLDDEDGWRYHTWVTQGDISLDVQTRKAYETDLIADGLMVALAMDSGLQEFINNTPYMHIIMNTKQIKQSDPMEQPMQNWDSEDIRYTQTFTIPVYIILRARAKYDELNGNVIEAVAINITSDDGTFDTSSLIE